MPQSGFGKDGEARNGATALFLAPFNRFLIDSN